MKWNGLHVFFYKHMDFEGEAQYAYFSPNFEADMLIVYAYHMLNVICTKLFLMCFYKNFNSTLYTWKHNGKHNLY